MVFYTREEFGTRKVALFEAIRLAGGADVLADWIGVDKSTLNRWTNHPIEIPGKKALLIEKRTGVSVRRLLPNEYELNEYLLERYSEHRFILRNVSRDSILVEESVSLPYLNPGRPIIIDTDGVLISGLMQWRVEQSSGKDRVLAVVVDLRAPLLDLEGYSLKPIDSRFLISECVDIGSRLEQLAGNRQGQRTDLLLRHKTNQKNHQNGSSLCSGGNEVMGRKDEKIAKFVRLNSIGTYHRAKQVRKHGIPELIEAVNLKQLSLTSVLDVVKLSEQEQREFLKTHTIQGGANRR